MNPIPLLRVGLAMPFVNFLTQVGAPTDHLLGQAALPMSLFEDSEKLLPLYQFLSFIEAAAHSEGIETLGLIVGQQTPPQALGAFGRIACNSLTLFDLLVTIEQNLPLANSGGNFGLQWETDWIWLKHHCNGPNAIQNLQSQRYALMLYINSLRLALGPDWFPSELQLEGPSCQETLRMNEFSETQIRFQSPCNAIKIPRAALSLPLNSAHRSPGLDASPDYKTFRLSAPAQDFVGSLKQVITVLLPSGYPDIKLVAEVADLSVRSLQRHIAKAGLTYSRLVEQVRFGVAVQLLKQPDVKLIEIATELGYSDPANFTRAFKRWTGVSPREFRIMHGE